MEKLPSEIKLTYHAIDRLKERNDTNNYDIQNLMNSSCKWYTTDDFIPQSALYLRSLYVTRKDRNKMGYITDGNIEVLYDKGVGVAITIMALNDRFKPITNFMKKEEK